MRQTAAKKKTRTSLEDVQNREDTRGIDIGQAGVCDLKYPVTVLDRENKKQHTVAEISLSVSLPKHFKGTHMSRFIEVLNRHRSEITMRTLPRILHELRKKLEARSARVELSFPYFVEKSAPVSGSKALMDYECTFLAETKDGFDDFILGVKVPVKSVCPCSKAISDYGAHNQRGIIDIQIRSRDGGGGPPELIWIEELIAYAEASASSPVYPLLKRRDERHVTMRAYEKPTFVEDIARNMAVKLREDKRVNWFKVRVVNQESIHNHSAFAQIESRKGKD